MKVQSFPKPKVELAQTLWEEEAGQQAEEWRSRSLVYQPGPRCDDQGSKLGEDLLSKQK